MLADLIFKEKSQTINIRKGMFLKIACKLWKIKFSTKPVDKQLFGKTLKFPDCYFFFISISLFSYFSMNWIFFHFPEILP